MFANNYSVNQELVVRGRIGDIEALQIIGPFDFSDEPLTSVVRQMLDEGVSALIVDLSRASYVSSPGIANIIKIFKKLRSRNGRLHMCGATPDMMDFFRLARIDKFITFH